MTRTMSWRRMALLAALLMMLAACSKSTRQLSTNLDDRTASSEAGPTSSGAAGVQTPGSSESPANEPQATASGSGATVAPPAIQDDGPQPSTSPTPGPGTGVASSNSPGSGSTPSDEPLGGDPIRVGFTVFNPAGVAGLTGTGTAPDGLGADPDQETAALRREVQALADYANATGGVDGREIQPLTYEIDTQDIDQSSRTTKCIRATEDDKVEAYIDNNGFFTEADFECFADHGVVYVGLGNTTDRKFLEANHPYVNTTYPALDRTVRAFVDGLDRSGYLDGAKIGVLLDDEPQVRRAYEDVMKPMLAARGAEPVDVAFINPTDQGAQASQAAAAVLRFNQRGVTHVPLVANVIVYLAFSQSAESQGYAPRYAFNDYQLMVGNGAQFKSGRQGVDAVAVTTLPSFLIAQDQQRARSSSDPVDPDRPSAAPGIRRCIDIYSQYLEQDYGNSPSRSARWATYCDHFLLWLDAARAVPGAYSPQRWGDGLATLGDSYESTLSKSEFFGPGVHDGASTYSFGIMSNVSGCSCYTPTSNQWYEIPR